MGKIRPPDRVLTRNQVVDLIEKECQEYLGVNTAEALEMLENGKLHGTAMQAELRGLLWLLGDDKAL